MYFQHPTDAVPNAESSRPMTPMTGEYVKLHDWYSLYLMDDILDISTARYLRLKNPEFKVLYYVIIYMCKARVRGDLEVRLVVRGDEGDSSKAELAMHCVADPCYDVPGEIVPLLQRGLGYVILTDS